ncbi:uncharacterized protein LOC106181652, partial [Lingula anatina]|uniref:Uncharacterized protein LOC106181652 n=1 Tax=Lingula anatina TaxID=7574 RepID=A0A2R2MTL4_LINAN
MRRKKEPGKERSMSRTPELHSYGGHAPFRMTSSSRKKFTETLLILVVLCGLCIANTRGACNCETDCASNCPAGTHWNNGSCSECPQGYYCPGGSTSMQACPAGTYNFQTSQIARANCTDCPAGSYSFAAGSVSCDECPAGKACPIGTSVPTDCSSGQYALNGSASCENCPAGFKCPEPYEPPVYCEEGTYQNTPGQTTCVTCPAGFGCPHRNDTEACAAGFESFAGDALCHQCQPGNYSYAGAAICELCPVGFECSNPATAPSQCGRGFVSVGGQTTCTACQSNEYTSGPGQSSCLPCPAGRKCSDPTQAPTSCTSGTYAYEGNGTCTVCPRGQYCTNPQSPPQDCPGGTYSDIGWTQCEPCPAAYGCADAASTPVQCSPGQYSAEGQTACTNCTAGTFCPTGATVEIACADGYYSETGWTACLACPPGYSCTASAATACSAGTYSTGLATACTPCPLGYYCADQGSTPVACPAGFYNVDPTATNCTICPAGFECPSTETVGSACNQGYQSTAGQTSCTICPAGYACPDTANPFHNSPCWAGSYSILGSETCTECPAGKYCPSTTEAVELACELGTISAGNVSECTACAAGWKCPNADGSGMVECQPGEFSEARASICTVCPKGYACPNTSMDYQVQCSAGTYSVGGQTECTACAAGKYCPSILAAVELNCPSGSFSVGNASSCTMCPPGYYCAATDSDSRIACDPGQYALGGKTACTDCEAGFKCPFTTTGQERCPNGFYSPAVSTNCTGCEAGYYCPRTEFNAKRECDPGTYSAGLMTACLACDAGYTCPAGSTSPRPNGTECNAGGFCDGRDFFGCPAGTYNPNNASKSIADCLPCPPGYYCQGTGNTGFESSPCPAGHYCLLGTQNPTQHACPGGTYSLVTNLTSASLCLPCPEGKYCPAGSSTDGLDCPAGFWCHASQGTGFLNPCSIGTYSNATGLVNSTQCVDCPVGHYCPWGSANAPRVTPLPCEPGYYNPLERTGHELNCKLCDAGWACPLIGQYNVTVPCSQGYYCPNGTITPDQYPCKPGTYTGRTDLTSAEECDPCPPGFYCSWGTGVDISPPQNCMPGYYCPAMTPTPDRYPCPSGTYSASANLSAADQCTPCDPGYYCNGGEPWTSGPCPRGYYCPEGTEYPTQYGCPNGTYNDVEGLYNETQCKTCHQGTYCEFAVSDVTVCPRGTFMPWGTNLTSGEVVLDYFIGAGIPAQRQFSCVDCVGGYYCLENTTTPIPCGTGFYSKPGQFECTVCQIGHYCDNETTSETMMLTEKRCPAGRYCLPGLHSESNALNCSKGMYCPEATVEEINCPVGTINRVTNGPDISACEPCPAGYYCLEGVFVESGMCDPGYYCDSPITNVYGSSPALIGPYGPRQAACPEGTYSNVSATPNVTMCLTCPRGYYCPVASIDPTDCPRGYYCVDGSSKPEPCPIGRYGNNTNLEQMTDCRLCDPGMYCDAPGLLQARGQCDPGFLCYSGATTSAPNDNTTGVICPRGGYCTSGSWEALPCPMGTYSNESGATTIQGCRDCDEGYYCSSVAGGEPTGLCWGGYYCTGGAHNPRQHIVDQGYYATNGSTAQTECAIGTYNPYYGQSECFVCDEGFYCPDKAMTNRTACPAGKYCMSGSYVPLDCPPGTFSNITHATSRDNCTICPKGYYCRDNGATAPAGQCKAGHICYESALDDDPVFNNDTAGNKTIILWGDRCPAGHYCLQGTAEPTPCPRGTYNPDKGGASIAACLDCDPGTYCAAAGLTHVSGLCSAGYFCTGGAHLPEPLDNSTTGGICPQHHICVNGTDTPSLCPAGYYANNTGLWECTLCIAGYLCLPGQAPVLCPRGQYCEASTDIIPVTQGTACPRGTYGNRVGLAAESECTDCDGGAYCLTTGLQNVTGLVSAGYWALTRAKVFAPEFDPETTADYGWCPKGHYCPAGTSEPIPCPAGSYGFSIKLGSESACTSCDPGTFCPSLNMTATGSPCAAGYYCIRGSPTATPVNETYGDICPTGYYCPVGSSSPQPCAAGTYANVTGTVTCPACPAGSYCPINTSWPIECPAGFACPESSVDAFTNPCPRGKYSNITGRSAVSECLSCPPGYYCGTTGLSTPTDLCDAGWFCTGGAEFAQPSASDQGGQCQPGYYCPNGTSAMIPCDPGEYCADTGLAAPNGLCDAGFFCLSGASSNAPTDGTTGNVCPAGSYCPSGSINGTLCPPGTFMNNTGSQQVADCLNCTAGYYCGGYGNVYPTGQCTEGYYCPEGISDPTPVLYPCPQGHYCARGSHEPVRCVAGYYQDETAQGACKLCLEGFYCDNTREPVVLYNTSYCPEGYYCPNGTRFSTEFPCPNGTYSSIQGLRSVGECTQCAGGYYCDEPALSNYTKLCNAGKYFCRLGAKSGTPLGEPNADECPAGFFCPEGSTEPQKCPLGTFSSNVRLTAATDCSNCTQGYYCNGLNLTTPTGQCWGGYYCPSNSQASTPDYALCPEGSYCINGSFVPEPCPQGTYSNLTGLAAASECLQCPGGYYCETPGLTAPTGLCGEGYYCPVGTIYQEPNTTYCPVGHYCPTGVAAPLPCRNGTHVNYTHAVNCLPCDAGYFCAAAGQSEICPVGYYCPEGTGLDIKSCPRGTYSDQTGLYDLNQCKPCPAGQHCDSEHLGSPSGNCAAGHWCIIGVDRPYPDGTNQTDAINETCYDWRQLGYGGRCPVGHYCPQSSQYPVVCANGTYADEEGLEACKTCPQGYYCPSGTTNYTDNPCTSGYYCPNGTEWWNQYPCAAGTYNNETLRTRVEDCLPCPGGYYCERESLSYPSGMCMAGYYCSGSATTPTPSGVGGNNCVAGYYCPEGSTFPTPCPGGYYCEVDMLNATSGQCDAGYYCTAMAVVSNPTDGNVTGDICPQGAYCPLGSDSPTLCQNGYFLNSTGNDASSDCISCTPGWYCPGSGNALPTGQCAAGYYCPGGQDSSQPTGYNCTLGHYCPLGSSAPLRCPSGQYQDEYGQVNCKPCPAAYYCDNTMDPVVLYNNTYCPAGFYCPGNTTQAYENPCPRGTFSNLTHRTDVSDCQQCSGGSYCETEGLVEPTGLCAAGYYCRSGSNSSTPTYSNDADECPIGHYCPQGSAAPLSCPPGTYTNATRRQSVEECSNCTGGVFCPSWNMTEPGSECQAGYYCPSGASVATHIQCDAGSYCPQGSVMPTPCPRGTFSNTTGLSLESECTNCTGGYYCPDTGLTAAELQCWGGYYCPEAVAVPNPVEYICPRGMHCPNGSAIYQECSEGTYANDTGASSCDTCPQGYYCLPVRPHNASLNAQQCPAGYYCPAGTGLDWQSCPAGTYSDQQGLYDVSQCISCPGGQYCQGEHNTAPTGNCSEGYYCTSGVDRPTPGADNSTINCTCPDQATFTGVGGVCPLGHYCPLGTTVAQPCNAGTYAAMVGMSLCTVCPQGFYCMANASEFLSTPCPEGHYCLNGTEHSTEHKCPPGTYNNLTQGTSLADCQPCPGGWYCEGQGNPQPTGQCQAGWYCTSAATNSNDTINGGQCQPGYYCPLGSQAPLDCPGGQYCQTPGLDTPTGLCSQGYYCMGTSSSPTPTGNITGDICPAGFYCEVGSQWPTPCAPGTYSPSVGNINVTDCVACSYGEYCANYSMVETSGNCTAGYYCPQGERTPDPYLCTVGHYCPEASSSPVLCPSGTYQDQTGQFGCKTCPSGYYCDNSYGVVVINETITCPAGYYCLDGTPRADTYPCPLGTFGNDTGYNSSGNCSPCSGGMHCSIVGRTAPVGLCTTGYYCRQYAESATPNQTTDANVCPQGSYCPEGTAEPVPCPPGTFGGTDGLRNSSECTLCHPGMYCEQQGLLNNEGDCKAGYYCEEGSVSSRSALCTLGHYCPTQTAVPFRCPQGTFNTYYGLNSSEQCTQCTPGQYCGDEGLNVTSGPCEPGFYCPGGQNDSRPADYPCPEGHYCPLNSSQPTPCANGTYMNHTMAPECYICDAGWYCLHGDLVQACPAGYFCPEGTGIDWQPCPFGTYSNQTGLSSTDQCTPCTGGYYCDQLAATSETAQCDAGYYCEYGVDRARPTGIANATLTNGTCQMPGGETGVGDICPPGSYCPIGTTHPQACGAGTFSNETGQALCHQCPEGYYCLEGAVVYENTECPPGHYCPAGTSSAYQYPCPEGSYYNATMARSLSDCLPCPGGQYCERQGLDYPTGLCSPGWYCSGNSSAANTTVSGGQCQPGYYCPQGSYEPQQCTPGMYCQTPGLEAPTGNCSAGFYCTLTSNTSMPTDGVTGNICPLGHYCPEGSTAQQPCPPGTFLNVTQQDEETDCMSCPLGQYCPGGGLAVPDGDCTEGYYCPGGMNMSTPHEYRCPVGHYCPTGSGAPIRCNNGTYQDQETQPTCITCPAGYFCDNTMAIVVLDNSTTVCPIGSYCPAGTSYSNEFLCPIGTFNNRTGLQQESDCSPCLGGYYCPMPGMVTPTDLCSPGYYCRQYANISAPDQGIDANICPAGQYCPEGSPAPINCPQGSYSNTTGLHADTDCTLCPAGSYCADTGMTNTSGPCEPGYYCELGSYHSRNITCPVGHYCPEGSGSPTPCPRGTYTNTLANVNVTQCVNCDEGTYCNDTGLSAPSGNCDPGFYCPGGNDVPNPVETPCPIGLHCPTGSGQPVPCPPGTFTNLTQMSECLTCPGGFYCVPEEVIQGNSSSGFRLCPRGYYCPDATGMNWTGCPAGTFSNELGLENDTQCLQCSAGQYCDITNLTAPAGDCAPGYYCTSGVDTPTPAGGHTGTGGICPAGHYCPGGTDLPIGCSNGTYQNLTNQASCLTCPAGYYCLASSVTFVDQVCPSGHYCPDGTRYDTEYPCPQGTFNNLTGSANSSACVQCTPGHFCASPGLSATTDQCDPGWYCTLRSYLAQPSSPEGGACVPGEYCPRGSSAPIQCDDGHFCPNATMSSTAGLCAAGYYCINGSITATPTGVGGNQCSPGTYCPDGSWYETLCPAGTYQPSNGATNETWCIQCTSGSYCNDSGLATPQGSCDPGYYCPGGQSVSNPNGLECPAGYYCPLGSSTFRICPSGTYQDWTQQSYCKWCPPGYYCDNSIEAVVNYTAYVCPQGHYCPNATQSSTENPCPIGTFNNGTGLGADTECSPCSGGYYCPSGTVLPTMPCSPGYYCRQGAQMAAPNQVTNADICPAGHYCPEQTTEPISCPVGTFSNDTGNMNVTDCAPCTRGWYCDQLNMTAPTGQCDAGWYCPEGSTSAQEVICTAGMYCLIGTHTPTRCPNGTWANSTGLAAESDCTPCTAGWYCQQSGLTYPEGLCQQGYYCPQGSNVPNPELCPIGLHCPEGSATPQSCASGYYTNQTGTWSCNICPDGFFCLPENVTAGDPQSGYHDCPAGYYCPNGTGLNWLPCPPGTYSMQTNLFRVEQCQDCDGGFYCGTWGATNITAPCAAGYYCESGVDRPNPNNAEVNSSYAADCPLTGGHTGFGDICPLGYMCPVGSVVPQGCDPGSYQDEEGTDYCKGCVEGYYCPQNSTTYADKPCPSGHYCPVNTTRDNENPCAQGTFNNLTAQVSLDACLNCTPGMYCLGTGQSWPKDNCSDGYYCTIGSTSPMPSNAAEGGQCQPGYYCPGGTEVPIPCDAGFYCDTPGLASPAAPCNQGYYCTLGASVGNPTDNVTGNICPEGHYCPAGSSAPQPCLVGYYLNSTGNSNPTDCILCTEGWYCGGEGLAEPTGMCQQGYYCPAGQVTHSPSNYTCPAGHFCLTGSPTPDPCPSGTYQDTEAAWDCKVCPDGFYCNATYGPVVYYAGYVCPEGHYCPNGTQHANQYPCPRGTFSNATGLVYEADCTPCTGGMACDVEGLITPPRLCSAGYFCRQGANMTAPTLGANADICPAGSYCLEGSSAPIPCPEGTYGNATGLTQEVECLNCTGGNFCNETGLTAVTGPCDPGFYCPEGSRRADSIICTAGYYCGQGTLDPMACPNGTFSNATGLSVVTQCTDCTEGYYCNGVALIEPSGPCSA